VSFFWRSKATRESCEKSESDENWEKFSGARQLFLPLKQPKAGKDENQVKFCHA
jgi:hypothetical protein